MKTPFSIWAPSAIHRGSIMPLRTSMLEEMPTLMSQAAIARRKVYLDTLLIGGKETVNIMADQQHLELLRQGGVDSWNTWRRLHPATLPDLYGADLSGADLGKYNLSTADLREANLHHANLSASDLIEANLNGANLASADLSGARLIEAKLAFCDLRSANLADADLSGADLTGTNLMAANLRGANLNWARLTDALISDEQLSTVESRLEETF